MDSLYSPKSYPPEIRDAILSMGALAIDIANRWMLGWPRETKILLASGNYLTALKEQWETEAKVLSDDSNTHLARHEIMQIYGIEPQPPLT